MIGNIVDLVAGHIGVDKQSNDEAPRRLHTHGKQRWYDRAGNEPNEHNAVSIADRIHDELYMSKVEKRVSSYLEHIQQAQADGKFQRIDSETHPKEKVVSWDQLHKAQVHNRHVYFAGMPLSHSKEVGQLKRNQERIVRQTEELVVELRKRDEHIEELEKKQNVDFRKFEVALGKAMGLGMGCNLFAEIVSRYLNRRRRHFYTALRCKRMEELRQSLESHSAKLRQKHRLAALVIARSIRRLMDSTLKEAMRHMRAAVPKPPRNNYPSVVEAIKGKKYGMMKTKAVKMHQSGKHSKKPGDRMGQVEESLLTRLEHLVAEEMQMLSTSHITT
ncbi:hypothetical protein X943_002491 [Babesia divergens]|uniref:Uncharacterized protein n=1 Tax=Babesia divergens TaxID=32595 RepID=A0AAD9GFW0_BABDI|nr:hypothetical protein X943_002491 [Babesia divergens]